MKEISFNGNWTENYLEKKFKIVDESMTQEIIGKYLKYKRIENIMKYVNPLTLKLGFTSYAKVINNMEEIYTKEKATGIDNMTKAEYEKNLDININILYSQLKEYRPEIIKRVYIKQMKVKEGQIYYKDRPLGIVTIPDGILQTTLVNQVLEPVIELLLTKETFAYRENTGVKDAIEYTIELMKCNYNYIISLDIKGYFDNINHDKLLSMIEQIFTDKVFIGIIRKMIKSEYYDMKNHNYEKIDKGVPQGAIMSPVLSNLYLHNVIDTWYKSLSIKGKISMSRYADDILIFLTDKRDINKVFNKVIERFNNFNLEISKEKSKIINLNTDKLDYLGYEITKKNNKIDKYINPDKIIIMKEEISKLISQSKTDINKEKTRKKLNKSLYNGKQYKDKYIKSMNDPLIGLYLQGYIKSINNKLTGLYKYYKDVVNKELLTELYMYAYKEFYNSWTNKIDKNDLMYILSNLISLDDYLISNYKKQTRIEANRIREKLLKKKK